MMVDLLMASNFKPGEDVIKEGIEGDSMYIVAGGDRVCGLVMNIDVKHICQQYVHLESCSFCLFF